MKPPLRTKSLSTKVSEEEFVALESRARAPKLTLSDWWGFARFGNVAQAYDRPTLVVQKEISVSRALAGQVLVKGTDELAGGVTVELRSSDWKDVLASTKTDAKGHFSLETPKMGKLFYIRVSAPGMDIYELRVRVNKHSPKELSIRISAAT